MLLVRIAMVAAGSALLLYGAHLPFGWQGGLTCTGGAWLVAAPIVPLLERA